MTIPHRLMMSEFHAKVDPDLGHVHRDNAKLLKGDNGLALYLMQELLKGEGSFYWPYLRVLPTPHNLRHWSEESLLELQDQKLLGRTALRTQQLRALYRDTMGVISRIYPDLFPVRVHVHTCDTRRFILCCGALFDTRPAKRNAYGRPRSCPLLVAAKRSLGSANGDNSTTTTAVDGVVFYELWMKLAEWMHPLMNTERLPFAGTLCYVLTNIPAPTSGHRANVSCGG